MIRSMTGYGEAERDTVAGLLRAEIKTVNHRYFSGNVRTPGALDRYEPQIREWLKAILQRGHVSCSVRLEATGPGSELPGLKLDEDRARQYHRLLTELKERLSLPGEVDVAMLTRFSDLIVRDDEARVELDEADLKSVVEAAARATLAMREREGESLAADLEERLAAMERSMRIIAERAPERLVRERDRMRQVVAELAEGVGVDEDRLAREIAHLAERWDVSEELVRLRSHIDLFRQLMAENGEPVGKRLSFLNQEMHREANTIGSKANDAPMEHEVVSIKNEIERLREQIENVE